MSLIVQYTFYDSESERRNGSDARLIQSLRTQLDQTNENLKLYKADIGRLSAGLAARESELSKLLGEGKLKWAENEVVADSMSRGDINRVKNVAEDEDEEEEEEDEEEDEDEEKEKDELGVEDDEEKDEEEGPENRDEYVDEYADEGEEEEDIDKDDGDYLQKITGSFRENIIEDFHPELKLHNEIEVDYLSQVVRNSSGDIIDDRHTTLPFITKFEKTRIIGERARQIDSGATPFIDIDPEIIDGYLIALEEFKLKKTPFIIRRPMPDGSSEYWKLSDLEIL